MALSLRVKGRISPRGWLPSKAPGKSINRLLAFLPPSLYTSLSFSSPSEALGSDFRV